MPNIVAHFERLLYLRNMHALLTPHGADTGRWGEKEREGGRAEGRERESREREQGESVRPIPQPYGRTILYD